MSTSARLSQDMTAIADHYEVIVVGSGYGGGVAACRLARAGRQVAVLERGRELRPGDYPDSLATSKDHMQIDTGRGKLGRADGMFNLHLNKDMFALVGCGLGGTSLINANVALAMDPALMAHLAWPRDIATDQATMTRCEARARAMLDARPYPEHHPTLNKLRALEMSAARMGQRFYRPPIAVNFADQINPFGVPQPACNNCGDCCSGCNVGAKNTTLMNYLPDARNHGAAIFTQTLVEWVERDGETWRLHLSPNGPDAPGKPRTVTADVVILGAGALGSTEILLRSKARGLPLPDKLGQNFSGNGDVLAFGYDSYFEAKPDAEGNPVPSPLNGVGVGANILSADHYPGPCITGVIDMRGGDDPSQGLVIEEGVIPGAMAAVLPAAFFFGNAIAGSFVSHGLDEVKPRLLDAQALGGVMQDNPTGLVDWAYKGPMARTQTYLVMSVDDGNGRLMLESDRLVIDWPSVGREGNVQRDNDLIRMAAEATHAQFLPNPVWTEPMGKKLITVHPVGGCGMGEDAASGVVNHKCQVFAGNAGTAVHPGLYVCDGAAMPGPVGVNPLLTISTVAERAMELLCADRKWSIDWASAPSRPLPDADNPAKRHRTPARYNDTGLEGAGHRLIALFKKAVQHLEDGAIDLAKKALHAIIDEDPDAMSPGFAFTETMEGWISRHPVGHPGPLQQRINDDFRVAAMWGQFAADSMAFKLTVATDDLNRLTTSPNHPASITGSVTCASLAKAPMQVSDGKFSLLKVDDAAAEGWKMTYDMVLARPEGPCRFHGFKILRERPGSNAWTDVTTLFVAVHDGADGKGALLAQGMLTLDLEDLLWQGQSITLDHPTSILGTALESVPAVRLAVSELFLARFAGFFALTLFKAYGGVLATLENFPATDAADTAARPRRTLALPNPESETLDLGGGFKGRLTRYRGGAKGPVIVAPGFSIRASSYAIDTVDINFAEALCKAGYDTWLFDYRGSPDSGSPLNPPLPFTIDDLAKTDWPAAIAHVRTATGAKDVQIVAHCIASLSLLMSMGLGTRGVRSAVCSQFTLHPITNWLNYFKADLGVVQQMAGMKELGGEFDFASGTTMTDRKVDFAAWNIPVPPGEACKNPTCRRIFAVYGPSYTHSQLNHWTHTTISEQFGKISIKPFEQLQAIIRKGAAMTADGKDVYLTTAAAKNMALPISFMSGSASQIFYPETAARTRQWLASVNDPALYRHQMMQGYAHMDLFIGKNAAVDVFPWIVSELDRFN